MYVRAARVVRPLVVYLRAVCGLPHVEFIGEVKCVRRRAELSTAMNPRCRDRGEASRVVGEVFEQCFKDTRPFDDIP